MKIAIVGTGISGLITAYLLNRNHDITVFEVNDYIGGHTATVDVEVESGKYPVDTGFIVFNDRTYPNFTKLMDVLGVESQNTEMSFGVKREDNGLEYRASNLDTLFAQRTNFFKPTFWGLIMGMLRFGHELEDDFKKGDIGEDQTLEAYVRDKGFSDNLLNNFIIPMGSAVWSSGEKNFLEFPIRTYAQFMHNHGMLTVDNHPQWKVIKGGSRSYIKPLTKDFSDKIRLNSPVTSVSRDENGVTVISGGTRKELFDCIVIASHTDTALHILRDPSDAETEILSAMPYQKNDVLLHTDASLLPIKKKAWASWNYYVPKEVTDSAKLTYNMNMLQSISSPEDLLVTLNSRDLIDSDSILGDFRYDHPIFSPAGQDAQGRWDEINGVNKTYYAGAYWRFGFHEDGMMSGLRVAEHLGETF